MIRHNLGHSVYTSRYTIIIEYCRGPQLLQTIFQKAFPKIFRLEKICILGFSNVLIALLKMRQSQNKPYLMWFQCQLQYRPKVSPIWVSVSVLDLNQNSGFGHIQYYGKFVLYKSKEYAQRA